MKPHHLLKFLLTLGIFWAVLGTPLHADETPPDPDEETKESGGGGGGGATGADGSLATISSNPWSNDGDAIFAASRNEEEDILPNIVKPFLPSGNLFQNLGNKDIRTAPDVNAVQAIIVFLAQAFMGKTNSGDTGLWLWRIAITTSYAGLLLSGFLMFQNVSQGKKSPGEAIISMITKIAIVVAMISVITPNVPSVLIGIINGITAEVGTWYHTGTSKGIAGGELLEAIHAQKMAAAASATGVALDSVRKALKAVGDTDEKSADLMQKIIDEINSDDAIKDALDGKSPAHKARLDHIENGIKGGYLAWVPTPVKSLWTWREDKVNTEVSKQATEVIEGALNRARDIINDNLKAGTVTDEADKQILAAITSAPQTVNLASIKYPSKVVRSYAYITFVYLALSIWGAGFGALVWTTLYAMPEEWNLSGVLVSGFKAMIGIILTAVLASIYIAASLNWTLEKNKEWLNSFYPLWQGLMQGGIGGAVMGFFTGMTLDEFIVGMLILTAPAQAALMIKGGNGLAEHAKSALHHNDASSSGLSGTLGQRNDMSQTSLGSSSMAGTMRGVAGNPMEASNLRGNLAPRPSLGN